GLLGSEPRPPSAGSVPRFGGGRFTAVRLPLRESDGPRAAGPGVSAGAPAGANPRGRSAALIAFVSRGGLHSGDELSCRKALQSLLLRKFVSRRPGTPPRCRRRTFWPFHWRCTDV